MPLIKSITLPNALKSSSCAIMLFFVAFPNSSEPTVSDQREERGGVGNARLFNVFFV
mgnify:CR=1 FL=1